MIRLMRLPMIPRDRTSRPSLSVPRSRSGVPSDEADEMGVHRDQAEEVVAPPFDEERQRARVVEVGAHQRLEGDRVQLLAFGDGVGDGPEGEAVLGEETDLVRRREGGAVGVGVLGGEELGEDRGQEQERHQDQPQHPRNGLAEAPPDKRPVALRGGGDSGEARVGGFAFVDRGHQLPPTRMRGSRTARRRSAMMLPMMRVAPRTRRSVAVT